MRTFALLNLLLWIIGSSDAFLARPHHHRPALHTLMVPRPSPSASAARVPIVSHSHVQFLENDEEEDDDDEDDSLWERLTSFVSQSVNSRKAKPASLTTAEKRARVQLKTFFRVGIPAAVAGVVATLIFPGLALLLCSNWSNPGTFSVLSQDSSQFVQNFLTVAGLLFSILVGQTYYFLYTQQESIYYALFEEVTEAKSLLEQVALVCQGRSMYSRCLESISKYVKTDLRQIKQDPATLLSARPVDDPLESIMYMTSVGVPSTVYETVKSLREARAQRLGALQRKLPTIHMILLWILAGIELVSFPLLGAGTQTIGGYNILTVEGILFGVMTSGIVLTMRVVGELWRPAGGAYNVDSVLSIMVKGLEEELKARMAGRRVSSTLAPSGARESLPRSIPPPPSLRGKDQNSTISSSGNDINATVQTQGADISVPAIRTYHWVRRRLGKKHSARRR